MTIEKISDNQIRATLTRSDLEDRHIRLAELVMGTEKARELFRDLMQQAYIEHGFETDEKFPLMIEAIPVSMDCLILVITRVDDPEEFEKRSDRFKKLISHDIDMQFNGDPKEDYEEDAVEDPEEEDADGSEVDAGTRMLQFFNDMLRKKFEEDKQAESGRSSDMEAEKESPEVSGKSSRKSSSRSGSGQKSRKKAALHIFSFPDMNTVSSCCALIEPFYKGESALYRNPFDREYLLVLRRPMEDDGSYDRACRLAGDFGFSVHHTDALESYFKEHYRTILSQDAIAGLSSLA